MAPIPVRNLNPTADQPFPSHITIPAQETFPASWWGKAMAVVVYHAYAFLSRYVTAKVPLDFIDYSTWVAYGQMRGWVSNHYCDTHDDVPLTHEEELAYDNHDCDVDGCDESGLPCVIGLRVWTDWI